MGRNMFDVFPDNPDDKHADGVANLSASLNYVLAHKCTHKMAIQHYDVRRPDGVFEERYWSPVNTPVFNNEGDITCILHSAEDVTEKTNKQREIDFLTLQIDKAQDAIYTVDENLHITNWNLGAQQLYGYSKEEVIGKYSHDILQTDAEDLERFRQTYKIDQGEYQTGVFKRKNKSGKDLWMRFSISTIRNNGTITGYVVLSYDITNQKQLWNQVNHLAQLVENSSEAIFSRGTDMLMISWNKGAEALFGFNKEEVIGKNVREIGFFDLSPDEIKKVQNMIVKGGTWQADMFFTKKNGSTFYWNHYGQCK